jgi:hypothetical protein
VRGLSHFRSANHLEPVTQIASYGVFGDLILRAALPTGRIVMDIARATLFCNDLAALIMGKALVPVLE